LIQDNLHGVTMSWFGHERENAMPLFAVTIKFTHDTERRVQVRPTHREYLKKLLEAGKLHESGPFVDDSGALIIYDAADVAEVQELLANDPYAPNGIVETVTINEWNRVMARES
jgi:uncharacterized protein YciI